MRRMLALLVVLVALAGCCKPQVVSSADLEEIDKAHELILPEYLRYVEADESLEDAEKKARELNVEALRSLIESSQENIERLEE